MSMSGARLCGKSNDHDTPKMVQITIVRNSPLIVRVADIACHPVHIRHARPLVIDSAVIMQTIDQMRSCPRMPADNDIGVFPSGNWLGQNHNWVAAQAEPNARNSSNRHGRSLRHARY